MTRNDDAELLAELRDLLEAVDAVPEAVLNAARGSYTWRTIDAELAQLAYDSAVDFDLAGVRSGTAGRLITFETDAVTIELDVEPAQGGYRVVGQLAPPQEAGVAIRHSRGMTPVGADALGRFSAEGIAPGPLGVRCELADGSVVVTDWLTL